MQGWIKLHRSLTEHWLFSFSEPEKALAWIDLIMSANHKPAKIMLKGKPVSIQRGQLAMSQVTLQKRWKWSQNKVKRFLVALENDRMISIKTNEVTTLITICNYDSFQGDERADERAGERSNERATDDLANDKQECNNKKNETTNTAKADQFDYEQVLDFWNRISVSHPTPSKRTMAVPEAIKKTIPSIYKKYLAIKKKANEQPDTKMQFIENYFYNVLNEGEKWVGKSANHSNFKIGIEYACRIKTFDKIIEWAAND